MAFHAYGNSPIPAGRHKMASMQLHKLFSPKDPNAPRYWMHESSGVLEPVIVDYLDGKVLSPEQVALMRAYLWQWVKSPVWAANWELDALRIHVAAAETDDDIHGCIGAAVKLGMDPL